MITEESVVRARATLPIVRPMLEKNAGLGSMLLRGAKALKGSKLGKGVGSKWKGVKQFGKESVTESGPLGMLAMTGGATIGLPMALGMGAKESTLGLFGMHNLPGQMKKTRQYVAQMRPKSSRTPTWNPADTMPKTSSTRGEITKFAFDQEEVRRALHLKKSIEKTATPLRGLLRATSKASDGSVGSWFAKGLAFGLAGTAIGVGTSLGAYGASRGLDTFRGIGKDRNYSKMLKADPSLKGEPEARTFFNVVHRASPYIAAEPVIAAATVRSMIDAPALDERKMKQIMEVEEQRQKTMHPMFSMGRGTPQAPRGLPDLPEM